MSIARVALCLVLGLGLAPGSAGQDGKPLPEKAAFLEGARQRLASDEQLQSQYTFKERRTELRRNEDGSYTPKQTKLYEVYPSLVPALTYRRLIMTDDAPTARQELQAEDRRQLERLQEYVEEVRGESARDRERRLAKEEERLDEDRRMLQDVVSALDFELLRREPVNGRPAIVVAFTPKPRARPTTREGRIVQHFSGHVWIDEEELQVVRAEARAIDTISFGLGILARIHEGLRGEFVRRQLADGAWLPVRAELQGTGRMLVFRKLDLSWVTEYFDYHRIDPEAPPAFIALPEDVRPEPRLRLTPRRGRG